MGRRCQRRHQVVRPEDDYAAARATADGDPSLPHRICLSSKFEHPLEERTPRRDRARRAQRRSSRRLPTAPFVRSFESESRARRADLAVATGLRRTTLLMSRSRSSSTRFCVTADRKLVRKLAGTPQPRITSPSSPTSPTNPTPNRARARPSAAARGCRRRLRAGCGRGAGPSGRRSSCGISRGA